MSFERWHELKRLFGEAQELPEGDRTNFVAEVSQANPALGTRLTELLQSSEMTMGMLDSEPSAAVRETLSGARIGPYQIIREIGNGGTSTVYLACRADGVFDKQVAVKVIHRALLSPELGERLKRERQILAILEHPNIARMLDAGVTPDQHAYIVMEYVDGVPIHTFCDSEVLSIEGKLRLFVAVLNSVAYAHQHLVVHRDLKPGNILVSRDGAPKLVDFGIAKLLDEQREKTTLTGHQVFTPEYASPEQFEGLAVSTATDVYSLGVVLYEAITGSLPYAVNSRFAHEKALAILGGRVVRPRTRMPTIPSDLEAILLKALQRKPEERYPTVTEFRQELERVLGGYPVLARHPSRFGRIVKFAGRNKRAAFAASVAVSVLAIAEVRLIHEKQRADRRSQEMQELAGTVMSETQGKLFAAFGASDAIAYLNESRVRYLDALLQDAPNDLALKRSLLNTLFMAGTVFGDPENIGVGRSKQSRATFERALALAEQLYRDQPNNPLEITNLGHALNYVGKAYRELQDLPRAKQHFQRAISLLARLENKPELKSAQQTLPLSLSYLALTNAELGEANAAIADVGKILRMREADVAASTGGEVERAERAMSIACWHLGRTMLKLRRFDDAADYALRGIRNEEGAHRRNPISPPTDLYLARHLVVLTHAENGRGHSADAFEHVTRACSLFERLRDRDYKTLSFAREHGLALSARASVEANRGRFAEALASLRVQFKLYKDYEARAEMSPAAYAELNECMKTIRRLERRR